VKGGEKTSKQVAQASQRDRAAPHNLRNLSNINPTPNGNFLSRFQLLFAPFRPVFGMEAFFHLSHTVLRKFGYLQKLGYCPQELYPKLRT